MTIETPIKSKPPRTNFVDTNFTLFNALEELAGTDEEEKQVYLSSLASVIKDFRNLPPNKYDVPGRRRCIGRCTLYPAEHRLEWHPPEAFDEEGNGLATLDLGDMNSDYPQGSTLRYYPVLGDHSKENPLVSSLIWLDFEKVNWTAEDLARPHRAGVEFQRLIPQGGDWVIGTPDMFHQDGEKGTYCHLIGRSNLIGGENALGTPERLGTRPDDEGYSPDSILAKFTLLNPLDSWGAIDKEVVHYVLPARRDDISQEAERNLLIVSVDA